MTRVPSAEILAALASELHRAGELCEKLEDVVARLVRDGGGASPEAAMRDAQAVDALAQHLHGLAGFAEALSAQEEAPGGYDPAPGLATITLAALASRLATQIGQSPTLQGSGHEEGELQLF